MNVSVEFEQDSEPPRDEKSCSIVATEIELKELENVKTFSPGKTLELYCGENLEIDLNDVEPSQLDGQFDLEKKPRKTHVP